MLHDISYKYIYIGVSIYMHWQSYPCIYMWDNSLREEKERKRGENIYNMRECVCVHNVMRMGCKCVTEWMTKRECTVVAVRVK